MKASLIQQPALALLEVWIESGGKSIYLTGDRCKPQYIVRMTFKRNADNRGNNVIFDIVDRNWSEVEAVLLEGKSASSTNLKFRYGWAEVPGRVSPIYQLKIAGWTSTIQPYGTDLRVEGLSEVCVVGGLNEGKSKVWEEPEIHKIVEEIGKKYGYQVETEPCKKIKIKGNDMETTDDKAIKLDQGSMSDLQFIADVLTKYAESTKGEGDYVCIIDDTAKKLIFKPRKMIGEEPVDNFVYFATKETDVIEWSVEISSDIMKGITGSGGNMGGVCINNVTNKKKNVQLSNTQGTEKKILDGDKIPVSSMTKEEAVTEIKTILPSAPSVAIPKAWNVNTYMKLFNLGGYNATMKILGNPRITPGYVITINVYDGNGALHYTSGRYKINGVTDVIERGFFYTELALFKNAGSTGEETGKGRK